MTVKFFVMSNKFQRCKVYSFFSWRLHVRTTSLVWRKRSLSVRRRNVTVAEENIIPGVLETSLHIPRNQSSVHTCFWFHRTTRIKHSPGWTWMRIEDDCSLNRSDSDSEHCPLKDRSAMDQLAVAKELAETMHSLIVTLQCP